jgi:ribosomal protein S18 acetylase RimI-like enzyme
METKFTEPGTLETDAVLVRNLRQSDLEAVVALDGIVSGRRRPRYFELMLERALKQSSLQISLVAELEGVVAGFLLGSLYYGEFGVAEPTASIEAIAVHPRFQRRHVGRALVRQLRQNLGALHIASVRTEVDWDDFDLLAFLQGEGFVPARRICLECPIDPTTPSKEETE